MATKTYQEQLESVQAAIADIETKGQTVDVNGRTLTRADLRTLYQREAQLRRLVDRESRGGIRVRRGVPID
jgi:phage-related minor tail protein